MTHTDDDLFPDDQPRPLSELSAGRIWGMLESAPDAMLMTDEDGVILAVNQQVEALFGHHRADLLGRHIEVLLPVRLRDVHRAHRTRYRADPVIRSLGEGLQLRAQRNDGSEFAVEVSLSPLHDDDGLAVVASIRDVSERERTTAHARRVQAAINAVHDGVFMFAADTLRFVYANDGASTQTGYSNDELLSMTPLHIKPEFTRSQFEKMIEPLLEGELDHLSFRTVHRTKSGRDTPVDIMLECRFEDGEWSADGQRNASEAETLLVAIVRDITDQVSVERRLALSEETFRTTFEHAPVGMTIAKINEHGQRVYERVNAAFAQLLGRSPESMVGIDFVDISHPDDRQQSEDAAREMAAGQRDALITEKRFLRADGEAVWTLIHSSVIERSDGVRTLTHVVDITDRRERQAERERLGTMEDRERIARDIHDLVIQRLFGAGMKLQAVIPDMVAESAMARSHEVIDELDSTISELRAAIFALQRPAAARSVREDIELAVEQCVDRLGFRPQLDVRGPVHEVSNRIVSEMQATLTEALSNIARHATASSAQVVVHVDTESVRLLVRDDGVGIEPNHPTGNGLKNMAERAAKLGGGCSFEASASGGCELIWSVQR